MKKENQVSSKCSKCKLPVGFTAENENKWGDIKKGTALCENCKKHNSLTEGIMYF